MYCKNCGKQLRKEARFCDYCGQATNDGGTQRNTAQRRTTGTQAKNTSRTTRSRAEYEKNKKRRELERKKAQKNRRIVAFLILLAIVGAAVLGFAVHNQTKKELEKDKQQVENTIEPQISEEQEEITDTQEADSTEKTDADKESEDEDVKTTSKPTATAKPSEKASDSKEDVKSDKKTKDAESEEATKTEKDFEAVSEECNVYRDERMNDIRCPYPKTFEQGSKSNKNTILSLVDPLNDGAMMICTDTVSSGQSASGLMKDYADGVGGKILSSDAGDGWYTISFERNNKVNHRKAVIADGKCVYYDFSYDADSGEKGSYEQYVEYIDYYLDKELESATKEEKDKK